jgi:tetratricopeptide (TPR) repeat protein
MCLGYAQTQGEFMKRFVLVLLFAVSACESKATKTQPGQTAATARAPDEVDAEMKAFLDGMLITSNVRPSYDPTWPITPEMEKQWYWIGPSAGGWGVKTPDELKKRLAKPVDEMRGGDLYLLTIVKDYPRALAGFKRQLKENPEDCDMATSVAELGGFFEGPDRTLEALAVADPQDSPQRRGWRGCSRGALLGQKAVLLFRAHKLEEARKTVNQAIELQDHLSPMMLARILLGAGKKKEALVQAELAVTEPNPPRDIGTFVYGLEEQEYFTLGLTQLENGQAEKAKQTWSVAAARYPRYPLFKRALVGPNHTVFEWQEQEADLWRHELARKLAFCGGMYAELGLEELSKECYRRSESLEPGAGLARQLVTLGLTKTEEAYEKLKEATKPDSSIELMTAYAWILLKKKQFPEAKQWAERALAVHPEDTKASSLMWQTCGEQQDYMCVIEYRKRVGLPTHFNVEKYKEVARAWKDQAIKNGEGLAAKEASSADTPKPPPLSALEIIPLGHRVPLELEGVIEALSARLPGVKVTAGALEPLPAASYQLEGDRVVLEMLLDKLRDEQGKIYVIEPDLVGQSGKFSFAGFDLARGRAVVSLSRLRSMSGHPRHNSTDLDEATLGPAQRRLQSELVGVSGRLLGLSYPCAASECSMRERRSVTDFVLTRQPLCDKHKTELSQRPKGP